MTEHAIVIGGSMAGLLAARVLSDYYGHVTVIDRDTLPAGRETRAGVPQGRHTHGLLAGGAYALEALFPGICAQSVEAGALSGDIVGDGRWFLEGGCHARFTSGLRGLLMSRPFLEGAVRENVRKLPNVEFRDDTTVSGLETDRQRVTGVRVRGGETVAADLVVDTAGRGSHAIQWLAQMGFPTPAEERVEVALSYTTRWFRRHRADLNGDVAIIIPPTPSGKRGGVMLAQEGDRWTVTLISHFGPPAPPELDGFIEYAATLPAPYIHEVVRRAEPLNEPFISRFPASVRRRYEKLDRFPEGYLVMGDAMSSFNPIYGQGMTVAALEAVELQRTLADGAANLARRFFARAAKVVDTPWAIVAGNDLRMKEAIGRRTVGIKVINAYMAKLHKAAHHDPVVALAFHNVANLLTPPPTVLHPRIAMRVLWGNLRQRPAQPPLAQAAQAGGAR
jgi:2-polyprenyl-6-methoxyphenol hydroxylase-like FAD-dependent oxidoreductase